jgi:hypothetical protein
MMSHVAVGLTREPPQVLLSDFNEFLPIDTTLQKTSRDFTESLIALIVLIYFFLKQLMKIPELVICYFVKYIYVTRIYRVAENYACYPNTWLLF